MKLYGLSKIMSFYCLCYGSKAILFNLIWSKKYHRFKWYSGKITSKDVIINTVNTKHWKFIGFMSSKNNYLIIED